MKEIKRSVPNLDETIHSLLGLKARLTPSWVDSVCQIVQTLHSRGSKAGLETAKSDGEETANDTVISKLNNEIRALNSRMNELSLQRRQVLNEFLDLKGSIRVFCRIRPISMGERLGKARPVASPDSGKVLLEVAGSISRSYSFDRVFHPSSSQDEVFKEVEPVIKSALDGYNACIFAYGQTGSGKTHTMEGNLDNPGVVPQMIQALLKQASDSNYKYKFSFSMLEIYLGNVKDLLVPQPVKPTDPMPPSLNIFTDPNGGIDIENLVAIPVSDCIQALRLYRVGCRLRSTASTNSNLNSSRSHCLIRISIACLDAPGRRRETNKVWLIDLGGSERVLKTKASGRRLDEGKAINLSLSALGDVIYALQRKKAHIPFRNSKLTQVLKDSLGDDSKTLMLVHVSPKEEDLCETLCTLNFAARVRSIHLGNEDPTEKARKEADMENLQAKIASIEHERQKLRGEVKKLNKELQSLTRSDSSRCEDECLILGDLRVNPDIYDNKIKDAGVVPSSKLPGFMRPTVCSRRKSETNQQIFYDKQLFQTRRRSVPANRAKSVIFPLKSSSQYNYGRSISGASLVGLNMKSSADFETENSIDTSEEKEAPVSYSRASNYHSTQHLKVDKWLRSRGCRSVPGGTKNRRVPAAPLPLKQKVNGQNTEESSHRQQKPEDFETRLTDKQYNKEQASTDEGGSSSSTVEVEMNKTQIRLNNGLMSEDQMVEAWFDASTTLEDESRHHTAGDDIQFHELDRGNMDFTVKVLQALGMSKECVCKYNDLEEEFCLSDSSWKLKPHSQEKSFEMNKEDGEKGASLGMFKIQRKTNPLEMKQKKALFTDHTYQKNTCISMHKFQSDGNKQNPGIYYLLREKVQIVYASALLGLQLQSLGFGDDFFHSLTL